MTFKAIEGKIEKTDDVYQNKMNETMMEDKEMQILKDRIRKDGKIREGNVLKVDSFLNHQMDVSLFREIGKEFKRRFEGEEITKILTIEASGIGIACVVAEVSTFRLSLQRRRRPKISQEMSIPHRWSPILTEESTTSSFPGSFSDRMTKCC